MKLKLILLLACVIGAGTVARAQETNAPAGTDFSSFDLITKRNIFDPNRSPNRPRVSTRPPRVDSFTLVGTMSYNKARFAFFDGNSSEYRTTLKPADKIGGYRITEIAPDYIVLAAASNQTINLPVGTGMRRQEGSAWKKSSRAEPEDAPVASSSTATPTKADTSSAPVLSGGESDAMKRLMLKRMSEK